MNVSEEIITKITNAAIEVMTKRANIEITGSYQAKEVSSADICNAIVSDPSGSAARRLAELVALGIEHYEAMA